MLVGEPWCLTPAEVGRLTLVQVQELYFRARDKDGNIKRDPDKTAKTTTPRDEFVDRWRRWGLSRERAEVLWREKQAEEKAKREAMKTDKRERVKRRAR